MCDTGPGAPGPAVFHQPPNELQTDQDRDDGLKHAAEMVKELVHDLVSLCLWRPVRAATPLSPHADGHQGNSATDAN